MDYIHYRLLWITLRALAPLLSVLPCNVNVAESSASLKLILIQIHSYNLNLSLHLESLERSHQDVGLAIRSHVFCVNSCSPLWAIQHGGDR